MTNARRFSAIYTTMTIVILFFLSACTSLSKEETILKQIPGTYYPTSCTSPEGDEYEIEDERLEIEEGGKGYFILHDNRYEIRWKYEDGILSFEDSSGDTFSGTFKDKVIDGIYFNNIHYIFSAKKNGQ